MKKGVFYMRFRDMIIGTSLCLISFGGGILFGFSITPQEEPITLTAQGHVAEETAKPTIKPQNTTAPPTEKPPEERFLLTVADDGISLYRLLPGGATSFLYKTETEISHLRQEDYEKLCKGIIVNSEKEARTLMEDFGS